MIKLWAYRWCNMHYVLALIGYHEREKRVHAVLAAARSNWESNELLLARLREN